MRSCVLRRFLTLLFHVKTSVEQTIKQDPLSKLQLSPLTVRCSAPRPKSDFGSRINTCGMRLQGVKSRPD